VRLGPCGPKAALLCVCAWALLLFPAAARAHEVLHSVEPGRAWAVHLRYADGEVLAYVPFEVYSPADPKIPHLKGRTDRDGYLAFVPGVPGAWRVKIVDDTGHGLDTTVEVPPPSAAGAAATANAPSGPTAAGPGTAAFALRPLLGAAAVALVFAALFFFYRRKGARP